MRKLARREALKLAVAAPMVLASGGLRAQGTWPNKPVIIACPYPAGGAGDIAVRTIFHRVSEILKQPVVIENRPGGASVVAATYVNGAPKDGYTWLFTGTQQVIVPVVLTNLNFDYRTAFVPVTQGCSYAQCFTVHMDSPIKTIEDLVAAAKANPDKFRCGTAALGNMNHLAMEELQRRAGIKFVHVPYRIAPEGPRDLANQQIDAIILTLSTLSPMIQSKKVRIIAVSTLQRSKALPDIPTVAESGYPGFDMNDWGALFAGTGTPEPIIQAMQEAVSSAAADRRVLDILLPQGTEPVGSKTADFIKFFESQREILTRVAKEANIQFG